MTTVATNPRPFAADDYPALAEVYKAARVGHQEGPDLLRYLDETGDPSHKHYRLVGEAAGRVVAAGEFYQNPGMYHPQKFSLRLAVLPNHRQQGLGAQLYDALMDALTPHDPLTLRGHVREDNEQARRFAEDRGFCEERRDWESVLDVAAFDPAPYEGVAERLEAQGIVIRTLKDLEDDPEMPRKFHELFSDVRLDVPRSEPPTPVPFERFYAWTFKAPDYTPKGSFVALDGDRYIGMSQLWKGEDSPDVFTGLTAVKREYRGRKIALALKLAGIAFAKRIGAPTIHTDNDSTNAPMLAVNNKLGFVWQPALITYVKHLKEA